MSYSTEISYRDLTLRHQVPQRCWDLFGFLNCMCGWCLSFRLKLHVINLDTYIPGSFIFFEKQLSQGLKHNQLKKRSFISRDKISDLFKNTTSGVHWRWGRSITRKPRPAQFSFPHKLDLHPHILLGRHESESHASSSNVACVWPSENGLGDRVREAWIQVTVVISFLHDLEWIALAPPPINPLSAKWREQHPPAWSLKD